LGVGGKRGNQGGVVEKKVQREREKGGGDRNWGKISWKSGEYKGGGLLMCLQGQWGQRQTKITKKKNKRKHNKEPCKLDEGTIDEKCKQSFWVWGKKKRNRGICIVFTPA